VESQRLFISHAAHEIRSPISAAYARLSLALRRSRDTVEYRHAIEEAVDSMKSLTVLAEDLLTLASTAADDHGGTAPIGIASAVSEATKLVADEAATRDVRILVSADDALPVQGRRRDLERMLRNLIENAVRHSPSGAAVIIDVYSDSRFVHIAVNDEGAGVPASHRALIFQPFFRGERERANGERGAGLGLAIAREIARHHGGDISLDSATGRGARFVAALPLTAATARVGVGKG
jgi:two-component system heavy metal sensor histidine kinase CusS